MSHDFVIKKDELLIYTSLFKKYHISYKTIPLSFNQQKEYIFVAVKIRRGEFRSLAIELQFIKELRERVGDL